MPTLAVATPTVTIGGQAVLLGTTATPRNGGSSTFTYAWTQTGGLPVTLVNADTSIARFVAPNPGGIHTFQASVSDGNGYSVSQTVTTRSNNAATVNPVVAQSVELGTALQFRVLASDPEQDQLTLVATGLPLGSTFSAATGDFAWANPAPAGNYTFTVVANDGSVNSAATTVTIAVTASTAPSGSSGATPSGGGGSASWWLIGALLLLLPSRRFERGRVVNSRLGVHYSP